MAKILLFPGMEMTAEMALSLDVEQYSKDELESMLPLIEKVYDALQEEEPEDIESQEYYEWAERMEALDDVMDEIQDALVE